VRDDDDRDRCAGLLFFDREGTPGRQPHAQRIEVVGRHQFDEGLPCRIAGRHAHHRIGVRHEPREHVVAVANVGVVRIREGAVGVGLRPVVAVEPDHVVDVACEGSEEECVDQSEHRAVRTNPEREDENGDDGEARSLRERPGAEAKILEEVAHNLLNGPARSVVPSLVAPTAWNAAATQVPAERIVPQ